MDNKKDKNILFASILFGILTIFASLVGVLPELIFLVLCFGLYFLPTIICFKKTFITQVFALNLLTGWTFVGWVIALIWALKNEK